MSDDVASCLFCSISTERIIAENDLAYAIRDGFPVTDGHTLVMVAINSLTMLVLYGLLGLALDGAADSDARALALSAVSELERWLAKRSARDATLDAHYAFARHEIRRLLDDPAAIENLMPVAAPPGSPIGSRSD